MKYLYIFFVGLISLGAQAQLPIYKMIQDPTGTPGKFVIYLEWPVNASNTNVTAFSGRTTMLYQAAAGTPTVTSLQGSWAVDQTIDSTLINSVCGGSTNPSNFSYLDFATNSTINFGNVSAGAVDTILRLQFSTTNYTDTARLVTGVNGVGGLYTPDNCLTGLGAQATLQYRTTSTGAVNTQALNQSSNLLPLPVELTSLEAQWQGKDALVSWSTASEVNTDFFMVQRSTDGINYTDLGMLSSKAVNGQSNAPLDYEWLDLDPPSRCFYRLKQVDFDGSMDLHGPVVLQRISLQAELRLYPNPSGNTLRLELSKTEPGQNELAIEIYNSVGQIVLNANLKEESAGSYSVDLSSLRSGTYFIRSSTLYASYDIIAFRKL